jgi:hypothetical protein
MGFTNRSKTNVARSESWTPAAALMNKLNKLEKEICCNKLYSTTVEVTNAQLINLATPVELVPAPEATQIIAPTTVLLEMFINGGAVANPGLNATPIIFHTGATDQIIQFTLVLRFSVDKVLIQGPINVITIGMADTQLIAGTNLVIAQGVNPGTLINPGAGMQDASLRVTTYYHIYDTA